ncbi:YdcF family protein [Candidatus Frankia alpina]|uniref:YdcF family protein n=1 Tax=Candidatus Frankia alpina TaxID=2699483 RepID=UPI0013D60E60|nr:YdcF family protein [Candidatus Frankia alpina]
MAILTRPAGHEDEGAWDVRPTTDLGRPAEADDRRTSQRRWRRRWLSLDTVAVVVTLIVSTLRLFVFPTLDPPSKADAIVALGGVDGGLGRALTLSREGYASTLVVSTPLNWCPSAAEAGAGVRVICFRPEPFTTQGEAHEIRLLASRDGWRKVIVVARRTQAERARLRVGRCFRGDVQLEAPSMPARSLPYNIAYEWGALVKALVLQRGC